MAEATQELAADGRVGPARARIVRAATMLFWRDGYHPVSTEAICRAAGVRKGSLYYAFPSKADILLACLHEVGEAEWSEVAALYAEASDDAAAAFRRHLGWFALEQRRLKAASGIVLGTFDMALGVSIPEPVLLAMREYRVRHVARMRASIEQVLGPRLADRADWLTDMVSQLVMGTMVRARLIDDVAPLEALPRMVFELIDVLRGAPPAVGG